MPPHDQTYARMKETKRAKVLVNEYQHSGTLPMGLHHARGTYHISMAAGKASSVVAFNKSDRCALTRS